MILYRNFEKEEIQHKDVAKGKIVCFFILFCSTSLIFLYEKGKIKSRDPHLTNYG
jgi:hypothetical protein